MRHWRCKVCGHIFRGTESPGKCPHCSAPQEMFHAITDENEHAYIKTEHKIAHTDNIEIHPFFGNFEHLAPYIYTIPAGEKLQKLIWLITKKERNIWKQITLKNSL